MEEWRICYETDEYEVSNLGQVQNVKTGRILKKSIDKYGREVVSIRVDGQTRTRKVHRLVAEAFYGDDCVGLDIYHRDKDQTNNQLDNLIISTRAEVTRNLNRKRVCCVETGEIFDSIRECSEAVGLSKSSISKCANDSFNHNRKGLHFKFVD